MKHLLSKEEMAYWDNYTIEQKYIPALVLMERAALACVDKILSFNPRPSHIGVICGPGNNGGDGVAIARILKCKGISADIYMLGNPSRYTDSLNSQLASAKAYGVQICDSDLEKFLQGRDLIVDAIFGIGLSRTVNEDFGKIIDDINASSAYVLAVDIPSGYDANTGAKLGFGVKADYTITFGYGKKGLYLSDCYLNAGEITIADIGIYIDEDMTMCADGDKAEGKDIRDRKKEARCIDDKNIRDIIDNKDNTDNTDNKDNTDNTDNTDNIDNTDNKGYIDNKDINNNRCYILENTDVEALLPPLSRGANKGTKGKALIIAGSKDIYGACYLSARAALTSGCGLVRIFTHSNNIQSIQCGIPEAMYYGYTEFDREDERQLCTMIEWADAVLIGPGLGTGDRSVRILETVLKHIGGDAESNNISEYNTKTAVIDADGINILSRKPSLKVLLGPHVILTPHLKEMSRLCDGASVDDIQNNMEFYARQIHDDLKCNIDLKSFTSFIVTDAGSFINTRGNEGMATAGSGDVLAGIMVSLLTQKVDISLAPAIAAFLHGKSGEMASETKGIRGMIASDIIDEV